VELPVKGNRLLPLFSLRGSGMVESTNWLLQLGAFDSTRLSAKTVHELGHAIYEVE
jgi:hypothetical protein